VRTEKKVHSTSRQVRGEAEAIGGMGAPIYTVRPRVGQQKAHRDVREKENVYGKRVKKGVINFVRI